MQDERSQHRNRAKAISVLRARLFDFQRAKFLAERNALRGEAVVTADRSQRVRTYNFPERRVTDHRVGVTLNGGLVGFMAGEASVFDQVVDALEQQERADARVRAGPDAAHRGGGAERAARLSERRVRGESSGTKWGVGALRV